MGRFFREQVVWAKPLLLFGLDEVWQGLKRIRDTDVTSHVASEGTNTTQQLHDTISIRYYRYYYGFVTER